MSTTSDGPLARRLFLVLVALFLFGIPHAHGGPFSGPPWDGTLEPVLGFGLLLGVLCGDPARALRRVPLWRANAVLGVLLAVALVSSSLAIPRGLLATYRTTPDGEPEVAWHFRDLDGATRIDRAIEFDDEDGRPLPLAFLDHRRHAPKGTRGWPAVDPASPTARDDYRPTPRLRPELEIEWTGYVVHEDPAAATFELRGGVANGLVVDSALGPAPVDVPVTGAGRVETPAVPFPQPWPIELEASVSLGPRVPSRVELFWSYQDRTPRAESDDRQFEPPAFLPDGVLYPEKPTEKELQLDAVAEGAAGTLALVRVMTAVGVLALLLLSARGRNLAFLAVVAFALATKLVLHEAYFSLPGSSVLQGPLNDDYTHATHAKAILFNSLWAPEGRAYYFAPLYRYFLAGVQVLFGEGLESIFLAQRMLGALSSGLVFLIGARIFGTRAGVIAAVLTALTPVLARWEATLYIASFGTFAATASVWALVRAWDEERLGPWVLAGLVTGVALLARPNTGFLLGIVLLGLAARRTRADLARAGVLLAGAVLCVLPVTIKNYVASGEVVPISTNGPINFFIGNNARADGTYSDPPKVAGEEPVALAWRFIRNRPGAWLELEFVKLGLLLGQRAFWPLFALGAVGWFLARLARRRATLPVTAGLLSVLLTCAVFFVEQRFVVPAVPLLAVFGGHALDRAFERVPLGPRTGGAAAAAALLAVLAAWLPLVHYGTAVLNRLQAPWNLGSWASVTRWMF